MGRIIIGIAGASGSGKTSLAGKLQDHYGRDNCLVISVDSYYKKREDRPEDIEKDNFDHPKTVELDLLAEHIKQLKSGKKVDVPVYDFKTSSRMSTVTTVVPREYIIIEGIFALQEELRSLIDVKVFVHVPQEICLARRLVRDNAERNLPFETGLQAYLQYTRPMFFEHILPTMEFANVRVNNGDNSQPIDITPVVNKADDCKVAVKGRGLVSGNPAGLFNGGSPQQEQASANDSLQISRN